MSKDAIDIVNGQIDKHKMNIQRIKDIFKEGNGTSTMLEEISMEHYAVKSLNEVLTEIGLHEVLTSE